MLSNIESPVFSPGKTRNIKGIYPGESLWYHWFLRYILGSLIVGVMGP